MKVFKFKDFINESFDNKFEEYYNQIMNNSYSDVSDKIWDNILLDGYPEEVNNWEGDFDKSNYKYLILNISESDKKCLKELNDDCIEKWNEFDIWLKDIAKLYPNYIDIIDYDSGEIYIVKYDPKNKLKESSMYAPNDSFSPGASFGYTALSSVNTGGSIQPKDPNLSFDAWDMHKNNMRDRMSRLSDLMSNIFATTNMSFSNNLEEIIQDITIVRIFKNNNGLLNIYLKFFYDEEIFYGVYKDWGNIREPIFISKILNIPGIAGNKENQIKIENVIKQILTEWFIPETGEYRALKDVNVRDWMGNICTIPKGGKIYITDVITEDDSPEIELEYSKKYYKITNLDYYYFHWWFNPEEKREYYI